MYKEIATQIASTYRRIESKVSGTLEMLLGTQQIVAGNGVLIVYSRGPRFGEDREGKPAYDPGTRRGSSSDRSPDKKDKPQRSRELYDPDPTEEPLGPGSEPWGF